MTKKNIFLTGASGCVGHYILEHLQQYKDLHVHAMVRNPERLKLHRFDTAKVTVHTCDMEEIETLTDIIKICHYVIHTATIWGGGDFANVINVEKSKVLFEATDDNICERIIYFSTASIVGKDAKIIPKEISKYGGGYIRSKHTAHEILQSLSMSDKITTLFPTLVFGGDNDFPHSHITSGIYSNLHILRFIRYIYVDGGFQFLHADDIAKIAVHLMLNPHEKSEYILGKDPQYVKDTIMTLATFFNMKPLFRIHIPKSFIFFIAKLFRITIGPWERYCINHSYMIFNTVSPEDFGLKTSFPTLLSLLEDIKGLYSKK